MMRKKEKHGFCSRDNTTPEYRAWQAIKSRCLNPNVKAYPHYGGRGIKVCRRWRESFKAFLADVGRRPSAMHSIERINNNGHYRPGNVRWATNREQSNNRRSTIFVKVDGVRIPLAEACRQLKLRPGTVWMRISRGASPNAAIARRR